MKLPNVQAHNIPFLEAVFQQMPFSRMSRPCSWQVISHLSGISIDHFKVFVGEEHQSFGIYLSMAEQEDEVWNHHMRDKEYFIMSRKAIITQTDISRLQAGHWLNDEVINGYIHILSGVIQEDTLLLHSRFWELVEKPIGKGADLKRQKVLSDVSYTCFTPLTTI